MKHKDIVQSNINAWIILSWVTVFMYPFLGIFAVIMMNRANRKLVGQIDGAKHDFDIAKKLIYLSFIICLVHFVALVCIFIVRFPD